jgi:DNA-binding protein HU-beta
MIRMLKSALFCGSITMLQLIPQYIGRSKLMNRAELVDAMAKETGLTKVDAEKALKAFTTVVSKELKKKGKVQLVGFGTFETSKRAARKGKNPQTGEAIKIPAAVVPKFKAGKALKDLVNGAKK